MTQIPDHVLTALRGFPDRIECFGGPIDGVVLYPNDSVVTDVHRETSDTVLGRSTLPPKWGPTDREHVIGFWWGSGVAFYEMESESRWVFIGFGEGQHD